MQIAKNTVVTLKYSVTDPSGNLVDDGAKPIVYLHGGYDGIFPKIEETLQGKSAGESLEVRLEPDDAFGDYDASMVFVEERNMFPDDIEVGMQFERGTHAGVEEGIFYTITDITDKKVVVDGNHPLAGQALHFTCTITDVREATKEEIEHGHIHGEGGHHH